jgi:hypothetical protein
MNDSSRFCEAVLPNRSVFKTKDVSAGGSASVFT